MVAADLAEARKAALMFSLAGRSDLGRRASRHGRRARWCAGWRPMAIDVITAGRDRVDLVRQAEVEAFVAAEKPDVVVIAAARVGGIAANAARPVDFLYDNLMIEANIMAASAAAKVAKLLFLGSSCIYPRLAPQPMAEDALLTGPLEPTNQWYAVAKIAGIKLARPIGGSTALISSAPCRPIFMARATITTWNRAMSSRRCCARPSRRAMRARPTMVVWGSGTPLREFMHVDDLADALVFLLENYSEDAHINVGSGIEVTIAEVAQAIADTVGFKGRTGVRSLSRPDGTPRKLMDSARLLAMGWRPRIGLQRRAGRRLCAFPGKRPRALCGAMKISVITVAFNAGATIGGACASVAAQDHAEHRAYHHRRRLDRRRPPPPSPPHARPGHVFVSEPDKGLYDAMNKGLARATGDLIGFLNADDFFCRTDAMSIVARAAAAAPRRRCHFGRRRHRCRR